MVDWMIHYVTENHKCDICGKEPDNNFKGFEGFANIHTHGLDKYGQKELCVSLDIGSDTIMPLLNSMGLRVQSGETVFTEGIRTDVLAGDYDVKFITFDNDDTLYMILPDSNNKLPGDEGCKAPYCYQEIYAKIISDDKESD